MTTNRPHPSTVIPLDQLSRLLRTSFMQAEPVCSYLVLGLAGLGPSAILGLKRSDVSWRDGTIELIADPASGPDGTSPRHTIHVPLFHRSWLALFATDASDQPFITMPPAEILRSLGEIRRTLRISWDDAMMRRTAFVLVLSHGIPCPDCIEALGFASCFPTCLKEQAAYPFGAWKHLLPQVVLPSEIYHKALGADPSRHHGRPQR